MTNNAIHALATMIEYMVFYATFAFLAILLLAIVAIRVYNKIMDINLKRKLKSGKIKYYQYLFEKFTKLLK